MPKKLAILGAVALVAAALVYWFAVRDRGTGRATPAATAPVDDAWGKPAARPRPAPEAPARRPGMGPVLSFETDPDGTLLLEGQVLDEADQPVAGAIVRISTNPPRTATTDQDGSFGFDKLLGRTYTLGARAGDRVGGPVRTKVVASAEPVVIRLRQGVALTVTVTDATSKQPIAGATIALADDSQPSQTSDDHGKVTFRGLDGGWTSVIATARGYGPATGNKVIGGDKAVSLELAMRRGAAVAGKVIDEQGRGVPGARVWADDAANMWLARGRDHGAVTSGPDGSFTIPALSAGSYVLRAQDETHAPASTAPITVTGETPTAGVEIVMKGAARIAGVVVDGQAQPVPYATVRVTSREWAVDMVDRQAAADDQGRFELHALPRAAVKLRAESETAASRAVDVDLAATPDQKDVRLVLDQTGTIAGIVVDGQGEPIAEAEVTAYPDFTKSGKVLEEFMIAQRAAATTDGGGRFVLAGLEDGAYRVQASRSSGGRTSQMRDEGVSATTGAKDVRIVLPAPGGVKGKLALASGDPPELAIVAADWEHRVTVRGGDFQLDDLAPGSYDLRVTGADFADKIVGDVAVEAGKITDAGTIKVKPGRKISGRVVDGKGQPVEGARVLFGTMLVGDGKQTGGDDPELQGGRIRAATTDPSGAFVLTGAPRGSGSLMAEHAERGRSIAEKFPAGDQDVKGLTLTLKGYGSVAGTVTRKGVPVGGAMVTVAPIGSSGQGTFVTAGADGSFVVDKVPEGANAVSAVKAGMMAMQGGGSRTVTVVAGQRADASLQLPAGDLTLTVAIEPVAGARIDLAQVFLFHRTVNVTNGGQLTDEFLNSRDHKEERGGSGTLAMSGAAGMIFWLGAQPPEVKFTELVAGTYSACVIPITGSLTDQHLMERIQNNVDKLEVVCRTITLTPAPVEQRLTVVAPQMKPLPAGDE